MFIEKFTSHVYYVLGYILALFLFHRFITLLDLFSSLIYLHLSPFYFCFLGFLLLCHFTFFVYFVYFLLFSYSLDPWLLLSEVISQFLLTSYVCSRVLVCKFLRSVLLHIGHLVHTYIFFSSGFIYLITS